MGWRARGIGAAGLAMAGFWIGLSAANLLGGVEGQGIRAQRLDTTVVLSGCEVQALLDLEPQPRRHRVHGTAIR